MGNLKDIVASSSKFQWVQDHVIAKLRPEEKLVIITQFCLVADVINEVCYFLDFRCLLRHQLKLHI